MSAIITTGFRVNNAAAFMNSTDTYYMFIGKPEAWADESTPDTPYDQLDHDNRIWESMISLKKVIPASMMSHGIIKRSWTSGKYYDLYRHDYGNSGVTGKNLDTGASTSPVSLAEANFYVVTDNGNIYICISNANGGQSTINPQSLTPDANYICSGADNYKWKFVAKTSSANSTRFSTPNFHPVMTLTVDPGAGDEYHTQWLAQANSATNAGAIYNVLLVGGGTGYGASLSNQAGVATVKGNGSGAAVGITTNGSGTITALTVNNVGSGYTWATIEFATGNGASATAIITPKAGLGTDPVSDLCAFNVITNTRFEYADGGDFPVTNDYRRVGMIVNPTNNGSAVVLTDNTSSACMTIKVTGTSGTWAPDMLIKDSTTNAYARIVDVNDGAGGDIGKKILRVIRTRADNQVVGAVPSASFVASHGIASDPAGVTGTIDAVVSPEVQLYSGKIIYVENRRPISRSIDQIESITTVFEY